MALVRAWSRAPVDITGGYVMAPDEERIVDTGPAHEQGLLSTGALTVVTDELVPPEGFEEAIIDSGPGDLPFFPWRWRLRDNVSIRDHAHGKGTGDADNTEAFGEMFAESNLSSINVPAPESGAYYNIDGIVQLNTPKRVWGAGGASLIRQQRMGRPAFFVNSDDVTIEDLGFAYEDGEKATASWTFDELDGPTNALVNQDSTISRSALVYLFGGDRNKVRRNDFENVYAAIRARGSDRYTTQAVDTEIIGNRFRDFEFGLLMMNQINPAVIGNMFRDTGSLGGAPPHAIYFAGAGALPPGVPVTGIPVTSDAGTDLFTTVDGEHNLEVGDDVQFPSLTGGAGLSTLTTYYVLASGWSPTTFRVSATQGGATINHTTNVTAGTVTDTVADMPIVGGIISDNFAWNNAYTSDFKLRNLRGTKVSNMHSYGSRRGLELAYSMGVVLDGVTIAAMQRGLSQDTELPGTDTLGAGLMASYCTDCKVRGVDIEMPTADYNTGIRVESSADLEFFSPDVKATFAAGGNPAALYKTVNSSDIWFYDPGWEINGVNSPAWRMYSSSRIHVVEPRIDSTFTDDAILIVTGCADIEVILNRDLMKARKIAVSDFFDDNGTNTLIRYVDRGVREQRYRSTSGSAVELTRDGKALGADNCLWIPPNTTQHIRGVVTARNTANQDSAAWTVECVVQRGSGSANPTLLGSETITKSHASAGASAWTLTRGFSNTHDAVFFQATGAAATTIEWRGRFEITGEN